MNTYESNGVFYVFEKDMYETSESYSERTWFIINKLKNSNCDIDIEQLQTMSRIMINVKTLNCTYSKNLMNKTLSS